MSKSRELPHVDDLVGYNFAVAGHEGTLGDKEDTMFIKPVKQPEIDFYNQANAEHPEFAEIMPLFWGTLTLASPEAQAAAKNLPEGASQLTGESQEQAAKILEEIHAGAIPHVGDKDKWVPKKRVDTNVAIALESASAGFKKPNILDAKLGVRLWADDAPREKRVRFDEISKATTHRDYGFRIAGMQVYQGAEEAELNKEGFKIYDKDFGRLHVNNDNIVDALRKYIFNPAAGIDVELGRAVADAFLKDLKHVQKVLESHESRMYSASLLFVFEGDGEALRAAIDETNAAVSLREGTVSTERTASDIADSEAPITVVGPGSGSKPGAIKVVSIGDAGGGDAELECLGRSNARVDSGIVIDECGELILPEGGIGGGGGAPLCDLAEVEDEDFDELSDEEDDMVELPPIYRLKLIDFAHAEFTPGLGPDENCLKGVRSLVEIFEKLSREEEK